MASDHGDILLHLGIVSKRWWQFYILKFWRINMANTDDLWALSELNFSCIAFEEFTPADLLAVLKLRQDVFVIEQECLYEDIDDVDERSLHLLMKAPSGELVGYCRIVPPGVKFELVSIGRVVTPLALRGRSLGTELMRQAVLATQKLYPGMDIEIEAQAHLQEFYGRFGFVRTSEEFLLDGIPHVKMELSSV
jgi:ElaA protein